MSRPPIHPGDILADELAEIGITATELARHLQVPQNRVTQIIAGKRAITGDTALRLGHWFGNSAAFWLNLQSAYDLRMAEATAGAEIKTLPVRAAIRVKQSNMVQQPVKPSRTGRASATGRSASPARSTRISSSSSTKTRNTTIAPAPPSKVTPTR